MDNNYKLAERQRIVCLDYLRVAATFAVIMIHMAAQNWYAVDIHSTDWKIFNFYDAIVRWAVPVFVMISGYLFLSRELEIKKIYSKYILRLMAAFAFWACIYSVWRGGKPEEIVLRAITGTEDHMWFIPMIIGLYICIPILKKLVESEKIAKYFLTICFVLGFLLPWIVMIVSHFGNDTLKEIVSAVNTDLMNMEFYFIKGYPFYFILGYYLFNADLCKKCRHIIYITGVFGFVSTYLLTSFATIKMETPVGDYYSYFSLNVLLEGVAVFVWFKHHCHGIKRLNRIISRMAKYSFGAYLVHFLVIRWLETAGITTMSFHQAISVPLISVVIFAGAFLISAVLNHIPYFKKYIV